MDHSTLLFLGALAVAFVFMRWLVAPAPQEVADDDVPALSSSSRARGGPSGRRRPVTDAMVEVVQSIAPQLTVAQIRQDLERSGTVEATIELFMETGTLPPAPEDRAEATVAPGAAPAEPQNLIEKLGLQDKMDLGEVEVENRWGDSKEERSSLLAQRRAEMVLRARKRLQGQLTNEVDMPIR
ncbi:CUE domain-containing protein [[Candida] zeylanoides]